MFPLQDGGRHPARSMTPNSVVSSPNHEDLVYPSPPTSPFIREPSNLRKKVVVVIQSTVSSDSVTSTVVESNISPLANLGAVDSSNISESASSEYESNPEPSSSSSDASEQKAKCRKMRRLTCPICKRKFVRRGTYRLHQYRKHGLLPIACEEEGCKERFATLSALFKHRAIHDPNSRYPCLICSRVFTTIHAFKVHSRIHSSSTFKCDECGLNFKRITAYRRHMKSRHPKGKSRAKGKPVVLSKEEVAKMDATLSRLRAIVPKPPTSAMPRKLPIARLSSASAAAATMPPTVPPLESLNPIADAAQSPTQLVNTVPLATFIPVYCAQALAVNNEQVLPHVYTISSSDVAPTANALPHGAYDNAYHADSSIYVQGRRSLIYFTVVLCNPPKTALVLP
uniref:Zinc finger protein n=1 Tax=Mesocestoides corti TaxID=53468 RepID=A0A5K3FD65_MESCO